jgi:hypothetical protein
MRFCILSPYYYTSYTLFFKNKNLGAFLSDRMHFLYPVLLLYNHSNTSKKYKKIDILQKHVQEIDKTLLVVGASPGRKHWNPNWVVW